MKLNLGIIISTIGLIIGIVNDKDLLWVPVFFIVSSIISLINSDWVRSDNLGSARNASMLLKFVFANFMLFSTLSVICIPILIVYWFV